MKIARTLPVLALAAPLPAAAQVAPGDLVIRANPNGNTIAFHSVDGSLLERTDGIDDEWRVGVALTHDYGWVTLKLDVVSPPAGWRMLSYDPQGTFLSEVVLPQIAEVSQFGVDRTSDGILVVLDVTRQRVHKYAENGAFLGFVDLTAAGIGAAILEPTGDGGFWVFSSGWPNSVGRGLRFDRTDRVIDSVTFTDEVLDVEVLDDGTFWTTKSYDSEVKHWDATGGLIESFFFDLGVTPAGQLRSPTSTATLPDGTLWVGVRLSTQMTRLDPSGVVLESFDSGVDYGVTEVRFVRDRPGIGSATCAGVPNQTGAPGRLIARGTAATPDNAFTLSATDLPRFVFGFFLASPTPDFVANPGGSAGNLCLGGAIGRFVGPNQIQNSGADGRIDLAVDLTDIPTPNGFVAVAPGETWHFQGWYRDIAQGAPTSNFTGALAVSFL